MTFKNYRVSCRVQSKLVATSLAVMTLACQGSALAQTKDNAPLIAQSSILGPITAAGAPTTRKKKRSIITDSLWGNLILELAYDKDPVLHKLSTGLKLANFATSFGVTAIAGGTLFQGIYALAAINPPDGHQDSYVPGITAITLASCTLATIISRQVVTHELSSHIRKRQYMLRDKVETLLAKLEETHCKDIASTSELADLIGNRAADEWIHMWRGTHRLSTEAHRVGVVPDGDRNSGVGTMPCIARTAHGATTTVSVVADASVSAGGTK
jgi:hypothetical protein